MYVLLPKFGVAQFTHLWERLAYWPLKLCWIINNWDKHWPVMLEFGTLVHDGSASPVSWLRPIMTGGRGGLKWQCSANNHLFSSTSYLPRSTYELSWFMLCRRSVPARRRQGSVRHRRRRNFVNWLLTNFSKLVRFLQVMDLSQTQGQGEWLTLLSEIDVG